MYNINIVVPLSTLQSKKEVIMPEEKKLKKFNPQIEMFSAFKKPFSEDSDKVVSADLERAAACCACTACTACR